MKNETTPSLLLCSHDGTLLNYSHHGKGMPLLLFVHGWTCRRAYWAPQLEHFATRQAVAAPDLPGHGDSGVGTRKYWSLESFAHDIIACINALEAEKVILIGHSMGGAVALEAARRLEKIVTSVVLVDTFVINYGGLTPADIQAIASPFEQDFVSAIAALVKQTSTASTPTSLQERLSRELAAADPTWALPVWRDLLSWSPQPAFDELQVPIHAINGSLIPDEARQRCAPFVTETIIQGAGHFPQMENPSGFNRVLEGVLAQLC